MIKNSVPGNIRTRNQFINSLANCMSRFLHSASRGMSAVPAGQMFTVHSSPHSVTTADEPNKRGGVPPVRRKTVSRFDQPFVATSVGILFGTALLLGSAQSVGAGTVILTFSDDDFTSTITASGSLDISDYTVLGQPNRSASSFGRMGSVVWSWSRSDKALISRQMRVPTVTVSELVEFGGGGIITFGSEEAYDSNLDWILNVSQRILAVDAGDITGTTVDFSGKKITFNDSLLNKLTDDEFHIELAFGGQKIILTTFSLLPEKPVGVTATGGDGQATLSWNDPEDSLITSYQYQVKSVHEDYGEWQNIERSDATTTSFTLDGLTNGESYTFRIRAINFLGRSGASDEVEVVPIVPGMPAAALLTATTGIQRAILSWEHAGDPSILRWQYQQRQDESAFGEEWTDIRGSTAETRGHVVRGLTGDSAYSFRVRAVNADHNGVASNVATVNVSPSSVELDKEAASLVLSEIGRATIAGAADIIDERLQAPRGSNSLTLGGKQVVETASLNDSVIEHQAGGWWSGNQAAESYNRPVEDAEVLNGSAFTLSLNEGGAGQDGSGLTVWGRGDLRHFAGGSDGNSWDGTTRSAWLGLDGWANERLLAGLAVSRGQSKVDLITDEIGGRVNTSLTAAWPYMQMSMPGGSGSVRVVLGLGSGEAEHQSGDGDVSRAKLAMTAALAGARFAVRHQGPVTYSLPVEAEVVQLKTEGDNSTAIGGLSVKSWRVRGGLEAAHAGIALSDSNWVLSPRISVSVRHDGGDGVNGRGVEIGGGFGLQAPDSRVSLNASGHWLATHSAEGQREWGASIGVLLAPDAQGHGFSASLRQEWGLQQDGALSDGALFQDSVESQSAPGALAARAGYGFGFLEGLMTVSADAQLTTGEDEVPLYGAGFEFGLPSGLTATVRGEHVASVDNPDTRIGAGLKLKF